MEESPDIAVIGAGLVGLACGAELARRGRRVVILERHGEAGQETSSRNSEVIHAGIYYPEDSLKALCCVEGRDLVYARCARDGVPHRRIGKLIVATEQDEVAALEVIAAKASANGARVEWLDAAAVALREPRVRAAAALWSPDTGIVDAHALMRSHHAELDAAGGVIAFGTSVVGLAPRSGGWRVETRDADGVAYGLEVSVVVNAAGLGASDVAALAGIDVDAAGWRIHPCKGDYFSVAPAKASLARHLIYPVPAGPGLGIHVTLDLGGRLRLGPDTEYVDAIDYGVDPAKAPAFARAARRYLPDLDVTDLQPEMAGIRPKLQGPGDDFRDFVVEESSDLGAPGMIHLVGIESPGLTAAESLARRAAALISVG